MQKVTSLTPVTSRRASSSRRLRRLIGVAALCFGTGALAVGASGWAPSAANAEKLRPMTGLERTLPSSFADIVDRVSPAVVNIQVTSHVTPAMTNMQGVPNNMREFFEHFFGQQGLPGPNGMPQQQREQKRMGAGSGFAIDAEGHIVTNAHVVDGADEITVTFKDGVTSTAKLVGVDEKTDLALIKIDTDKPIPYVAFGKSDDVRVGDWVLTVGNPFGLGHSVNVGIVSARGRTIGAGPYDDFLQIDAPINRGNSGGPAFDVNGNVVGVNAAIFSPNGGNVGIGFAIPSEIAEKVIADLKADGVVERGWLGVSIQPVNDDIAHSLGMKKAEGALVAEISDASPAADAGIQVGDVIVAVNDERIEELRELPRVVADIEPGQRSDVTVWRDGAETNLNVEIGSQPHAKKVADARTESGPVEDEIGLSLKSLDRDTAKRLGLDTDAEGIVVVGVKPGSPANARGFRVGDVLTKAGGKKLADPQDLVDEIADAKRKGKKSLLALVKRGDAQRFITLPVGAA